MRGPRPAAALVSLVLLTATCCSGDDDDSSADQGPSTTSADASGATPRPVPGFDGTTIRVGAITSASGPQSVVGGAVTAGHQAYFDTLNAAGGVAGRYRVELVLDDVVAAGAPADAAYDAMKADVVLFGQVFGTDVVDQLLPRLAADGVVAAPASLDSSWVHEPQLLPIGGPYQVQAANALTWYVEGGNGGTPDDVACALVRDDRFGEAGLEGFEAAAATTGVTLAEVARFAPGETEFSVQLASLGVAGCDVVLFVGLPPEAAEAMAQAASYFPAFEPQWIGQSASWLGQLAEGEVGPYLQEHFVVVAEGTEWGDTSVPGMAQLLEDAPPGQGPSLHFEFGYAQARAVHQVLEAAVAAGDLSRDGIVEAMASIEVLAFDGLLGDYGYGAPEDREPPRASTIFAVDPEVPGGLRVLEAGVISEAAEALDL